MSGAATARTSPGRNRAPGLVRSRRPDPDPLELRDPAAERDLLAGMLLGLVARVPPRAFAGAFIHELIAEAIEDGHRDLPAIVEVLPEQWQGRATQVLYQLDFDLSRRQVREAATVVRSLWQMRKLLRAADRLEDTVARRSGPFSRVTWHGYVLGLRELQDEVQAWTA